MGYSKSTLQNEFYGYSHMHIFFMIKIFMILILLLLIVVIYFVNSEYGIFRYITLCICIGILVIECFSFSKYLHIEDLLEKNKSFDGNNSSSSYTRNIEADDSTVSTYTPNDGGENEINYPHDLYPMKF